MSDDIYGLSRPTTPEVQSAEPVALEKPPPEKRAPSVAFGQLPDEIIGQILRVCDANTFASLVLLNSNWRRVSQQSHLYAHHLYNGRPTSQDVSPDALPHLRELFIQQVKRNLYEAYLRPRETIITLVSISISSSAAFPGGEAFHFAFSSKGHHILAYSSSRIYVINVTGEDLEVKRELKILRRPASATILDDGSILAVLSTDHQVDLYNLASTPPKHVRAIALDHAPRTIALSAAGSVLAAAFDGGVEVYSLAASSSVSDRRAVKCDAADSLSFSKDGTQLLATTFHSTIPSTIILTAPYYDPGDSMAEDAVSQLWTTSILFPHSSRDCSHAVLLPTPPDEEISWSFAYDRTLETFRAVRIDDLRNGTTYFTGPVETQFSAKKLLPSTLPSASGTGELVSAGFRGRELWLYGVPDNLEANAEGTDGENESASGTPSRMNSGSSSRSPQQAWVRNTNNTGRIPQWQILCDKYRNTFAQGRKISDLIGINAVKWVDSDQTTSPRERLVAVAPGVIDTQMEADEDGIPPVDGGRLHILDFDYGTSEGEKRYVTIEVGQREPEVLEEDIRDIETEIAIVRRRTVAQRRRGGGGGGVLRSATVAPGRQQLSTFSPPIPPMPSMSPGARSPRRRESTISGISDTASIDDDGAALDAPYTQGAPRSGDTLRRAATAAAVNRRLHPPRVVAGQPIEYRRADGREEHPHESDADNWVPPPPPYCKDAIAPLPEHLRNAVVAGSVPISPPGALHRSATQRTTSSTESDILTGLQRSRTTYLSRNDSSAATFPRDFFSSGRTNAASTIPERRSMDSLDFNRDTPSPADEDDILDDIYDVSPAQTPPRAESPEMEPAPIPQQKNLIPRKPIGAVQGITEAEPEIFPQTSPESASTDNISQILEFGPGLRKPIPPIPEQMTSGPVPISESAQPKEVQFPAIKAMREEERPTSSGSSTSKNRLDAPLPPRPNNDHRLVEPPPPTPTQVEPERGHSPELTPINSSKSIRLSTSPIQELPSTISQMTPPIPAQNPARVEPEGGHSPELTPVSSSKSIRLSTSPIQDLPSTISQMAPPIPAQNPARIVVHSVPAPLNSPSNYGLPSAAQLARLSSRSGRPSSIIDHTRRASGTFSQPQGIIGQPPRRGSGTFSQYPSAAVDSQASGSFGASQRNSVTFNQPPNPGNPHNYRRGSGNFGGPPQPQQINAVPKAGYPSMPLAPVQAVRVPAHITLDDGIIRPQDNYYTPRASTDPYNPRSQELRQIQNSNIRGISNGPNQFGASDPNLSLRPRAQRLETIHSITSETDTGPQPLIRSLTGSITVGVIRSGTKVENNRAGMKYANDKVKEKKTRGWGGMGTMKRRKSAKNKGKDREYRRHGGSSVGAGGESAGYVERRREGAQETGWTALDDMRGASVPVKERRGSESKGGKKCAVM